MCCVELLIGYDAGESFCILGPRFEIERFQFTWFCEFALLLLNLRTVNGGYSDSLSCKLKNIFSCKSSSFMVAAAATLQKQVFYIYITEFRLASRFQNYEYWQFYTSDTNIGHGQFRHACRFQVGSPAWQHRRCSSPTQPCVSSPCHAWISPTHKIQHASQSAECGEYCDVSVRLCVRYVTRGVTVQSWGPIQCQLSFAKQPYKDKFPFEKKKHTWIELSSSSPSDAGCLAFSFAFARAINASLSAPTLAPWSSHPCALACMSLWCKVLQACRLSYQTQHALRLCQTRNNNHQNVSKN